MLDRRAAALIHNFAVRNRRIGNSYFDVIAREDPGASQSYFDYLAAMPVEFDVVADFIGGVGENKNARVGML